MRNLTGLSILFSLGLCWGCGSPKSTDGATTGGTSTQPSSAGSGATATSPGAGMAAAAGKAATGATTTTTGAANTSGATPAGGMKAGGAATTTTTTTTTTMMPATTAAAGSGAAGGGAATATTGMMAAAGATGGAAGGGAATSSGTGMGAGSCGPENTNPPAMLDQMGPWTPMHMERMGPSGASWVFFPADLGKDGMKHPVFDWGPGAGTGPDSYVDHLNLLASQGFVVISQASTNSGTAALDWILAENKKEGSMWYGKLDETRVGQGGHSMGALLTLSEGKDPRLNLYVLVCGGCMSGRGGCGSADFHAPSIFLGGEGEGGTVNFEGDFMDIKTSPSYFVTKTDTDHIYCARNNLQPWVAFMRMEWCGEKDKYQKELLDGGTFCKAPWLACKTKNTM